MHIKVISVVISLKVMSYHTFCSFLANLAILAQNDPLWFYLENEYQAKRFAFFEFLYETKKIEVGRPKISIYVPPPTSSCCGRRTVAMLLVKKVANAFLGEVWTQ